MFFAVVRQFFDLAAADVHQRDGYDRHERMLDGKETQACIFHGGAHIGQGSLDERADEEKDQTEQELDIEEDHKKQTGLCIGGRIRFFAANAHEGTKYGPYPEEEYQPSYDGVDT